MKVTNRLRVCRAERRISQMDVAQRARVSRDRIWKFENGYAEPTPEEQERLAKALRVPVEEVFPGAVHADGGVAS